MARKRMVSPELLTSMSVASLPIAARYGFVGLWTYLDDEGRGKDSAALIKAHIWPLDEGYTTKKVEADIVRWALAGLVCRYRLIEGDFLHAPNWTRWQKISHKSECRIPPCPLELHGVDHDTAPDDLRNSSGVLREEGLRAHEWLLPNVVQFKRDESKSSHTLTPEVPQNRSGSGWS